MRPPRPWRTSDSTLRSGVIVVAFVALMDFVVVGAGAGPSHAGTVVTPPPVERSADLASKGSLVLDPAVGPAGFGSTLSGWSQITVGPHPSGRGTPAMAFDPLDNYTLLFSGGWSGGSGTNDTWTFHNGAWNNLSSGIHHAPSPREDAAVAYDAADQEILLFGGYTNYPSHSGGYILNDTWAYKGGVWTNLSSALTTAPPGRLYTSFVYDAADREVVLYGGQDLATTSSLGDTWAFQHGAWRDLTSSLSVSPPARGSSAAAYDPVSQSVILYGGYNAPTSGYFSDTWSFAHDNWTNLAPPTHPPAVRGAVLTYSRGYLVLTGGVDSSTTAYNETWAWIGTGWTDLTSLWATGPVPAWFGGMANDSSDGVAVYFGGCLALGCATANSETWVYNYTIPLTVSITGSATEVSAPLEVYAIAGGGAFYYAQYFYLGLPPGCASANTPMLTCRPNAAGTFNVTVQVTDELGDQALSSVLGLVVAPGATVGLALAANAIDLGMNDTFSVSVSGGALPSQLHYGGLPPGCVTTDMTLLTCVPTQSGVFSVFAWVNDADGGNFSSAQTALTVNLDPGVSISESAGGGVGPLVVTFGAVEHGGTGPFAISWVFGDAAIALGPAPSHTFVAIGTYHVTAFLNDSLGRMTEATTSIQVTAPLSVALSATPDVLDVGGSVLLRADIAGGATPYQIAWPTLPSGCTSLNATEYSCVAGAAGSVPALVSVTDTWGTSNQSAVQFVVNPALAGTIAATAGSSPCAGPWPYQFSAAISGGTVPYSYVWQWGDLSGVTNGSAGPSHTFKAAGDYPVRLTVGDAAGGHLLLGTNVSVVPPPCVSPSSNGPGAVPTLWVAVGAGAIVAVVAVTLLWRRRPS